MPQTKTLHRSLQVMTSRRLPPVIFRRALYEYGALVVVALTRHGGQTISHGANLGSGHAEVELLRRIKVATERVRAHFLDGILLVVLYGAVVKFAAAASRADEAEDLDVSVFGGVDFSGENGGVGGCEGWERERGSDEDIYGNEVLHVVEIAVADSLQWSIKVETTRKRVLCMRQPSTRRHSKGIYGSEK